MASQVRTSVRPFTVQVGRRPDNGLSSVLFMVLDQVGGDHKQRHFGAYAARDDAYAVAEIVADHAYRRFDLTNAVPTVEDVRRLFFSAHQVLLDRIAFETALDAHLFAGPQWCPACAVGY